MPHPFSLACAPLRFFCSKDHLRVLTWVNRIDNATVIVPPCPRSSEWVPSLPGMTPSTPYLPQNFGDEITEHDRCHEQALDAKYPRLHCLDSGTVGDMGKSQQHRRHQTVFESSHHQEACPDVTHVGTTLTCEAGGFDAQAPSASETAQLPVRRGGWRDHRRHAEQKFSLPRWCRRVG